MILCCHGFMVVEMVTFWLELGIRDLGFGIGWNARSYFLYFSIPETTTFAGFGISPFIPRIYLIYLTAAVDLEQSSDRKCYWKNVVSEFVRGEQGWDALWVWAAADEKFVDNIILIMRGLISAETVFFTWLGYWLALVCVFNGLITFFSFSPVFWWWYFT